MYEKLARMELDVDAGHVLISMVHVKEDIADIDYYETMVFCNDEELFEFRTDYRDVAERDFLKACLMFKGIRIN